MNWSGRRFRARLKAIREAGATWTENRDPVPSADSLSDLVRGYTRRRRDDHEAPEPDAQSDAARSDADGGPSIEEVLPTVLPDEAAVPDFVRPTFPAGDGPSGDPKRAASSSGDVDRRFAGFGRRRRDHRAGRPATQQSSEWPGHDGAASQRREPVRQPDGEGPLQRDDALWFLEERIDPSLASPDHFSPDFSLDEYRQRRTHDGVELPAADRLIYFDLETTGLASHDLLFMSGVLYWENETLVLRQEVAEDVTEERALVARTRDRIHERGVVVTYNGRSFDLPALDRRLRFHGLEPLRRDAIVVYDLLHLARRRFRKELPNCKLSTLEREVIQKEREGRDVPGSEVPLRFLDFRASGDRGHLDPVLYHNRIDLTTMVALFPHLLDRPKDRDDFPETPAPGEAAGEPPGDPTRRIG